MNLCCRLKTVSGTSSVKSGLFSFLICDAVIHSSVAFEGLKPHDPQFWRSVRCILFLEAVSRLWHELDTETNSDVFISVGNLYCNFLSEFVLTKYSYGDQVCLVYEGQRQWVQNSLANLEWRGLLWRIWVWWGGNTEWKSKLYQYALDSPG